MSRPLVKFARLSPHARLPQYMSEGAAGMDLCSASEEEIRVAPGARVAVPTGLAMQMPSGYEAQVRPRSGLAIKAGVTVVNAPGTVDSDYRGEVKVLLVNLSQQEHVIGLGDRIAQMVIAPVVQAEVTWAEDGLSDTQRGAGGFGSTGKQ